jgi:hypothetical protein
MQRRSKSQYVACQELGSPPRRRIPWHDKKTLTAREKTIAMFQTWNSLPAIPDLTHWRKVRTNPKVARKVKTLPNYEDRSVSKSKASPAGGVKIIRSHE